MNSRHSLAFRVETVQPRSGIDDEPCVVSVVSERQGRRIQQQLFRQTITHASRTLLSGPFAAVAIYLCLRSPKIRPLEVIWVLVQATTSLSGAVWCRKALKHEHISPWKYRAVLSAHIVPAACLSLFFSPPPISLRSTMEVAAATIVTVVMIVMTAADRVFGLALLIGATMLSLFGLDALSSFSILNRLFDGVVVILGIAPLIDTVYRPQRKSIELTIQNEHLVHDLRLVNASLAEQVTTDPLTGLSNRLALERAFTDARPIGLLYVDVDHFKSINDRDGHAAGDDVLLRLGDVLRKCARAGDVVARLGGDEFVILLDRAPAEVVDEVAHRLKRVVRAEFAGLGISVSIGGTMGDLRSEAGSAMLARADSNLYKAKQGGRNRVFIDA